MARKPTGEAAEHEAELGQSESAAAVTEGVGAEPTPSDDGEQASAIQGEAGAESTTGAVDADAAADAQATADDGDTAAAGGESEDGEAVEQDLDELSAKAAKADEYLELAKRTQADFENYRKRAARDAAQAQQRGIARLTKELLPAIDNLELALAAATDTDDPMAEGIGLVKTELLAALGRVGIESFTPAGERFDPTVHEAVAQTEVEGVETGTVADVFQPGYRLGDLILRPARVLVAA